MLLENRICYTFPVMLPNHLHRYGARAMGAATVALFLIPYGSATAERRATGADLLGKPAPPFSSASVNRGSQCLSSYRGKVVLLDFWSTWCGPCRREMPAILRIYNMFKGNEFTIIGISLDRGRGRLVNYLRENKVDWPIIFDGKGWKNRVAQQYQAHGIPFTVLLDGKGIVREVGLRGEKLEDDIAALLSPAGE